MPSERKPIHPGEVLLEVYMKPSCPPLTVSALTEALGVPHRYLSDFLGGKRPVTPALAGQLGVVCQTTAVYWLSLQRTYDFMTKHASRKAAA